MVGWITSRADSATVSRRSLAVSLRPSACRRSDRCRRLFSAMMIAPSTISPKSSAPRLIRLALSLPASMPIEVTSMVIGMTVAVMRAARKLPSIKNRTRTTSRAPRERLVATVCTVASTSSVRLSTDRARMPGGSVRLISLIFASAADEHQGGAQHHLVAVHACAACPKFAAHGDLCHVPHAHRDAAAGGDGDLLDLGEACDQAVGPHHVTLAVPFDVICAAAVVVRFNRVDDLAEGNAVSDEARRIGFDPILLDIAPDGVRTGNARHGPHLRTNDPVLYGAEVDQTLQIIGEALPFRSEIRAVALPTGLAVMRRRGCQGWIVFDGPPIDLAEPRRDRPHDHVDIGRQVRLGRRQAFSHLLTGKVDVRPVAEDGGDLGKPVARKGPGVFEARDAGERDLDRKGDLLFDFQWR